MSAAERLRSRFLGGLLGSALGDAIGERAFGMSAERLRLSLAAPATLRYTDDTAMAIGLAESLIAKCGVDEQHLGDTFAANYFREPDRGYAGGPPQLFHAVRERGGFYTEMARRMFGGSGSFGNGAAMRIAPLGLFFHDAPDLYEQAARSAAVTHGHPVGQDGAAVLARAVAQAVRLNPPGGLAAGAFLAALIGFARTDAIRLKVQTIARLLEEQAPPARASDQLGRGIAMDESLPFALFAFLRHPESFEDCLFCAILHGGDRDTLGAMACAVSGAYLGIEAIPAGWVAKLENRAYIERLALGLLEARGPRAGG